MTRPHRITCLALGVAVSLLTAPHAVAQPKPGYSPSSTHIFPAGGQRGTTVQVRVGTECTPGGTEFLVYGQGVQAGARLDTRLPRHLGEPDPRRKPTEVPITYPREWKQEIRIADDAPLGQALWRISCAQGGTATRPFLVGDLPEHIERESNSTPSRAEPLKLPVTLNGQIYGERDVDFFRVPLRANDVLVCDVMAGRIGSRLDPIIQLLDPSGVPVEPQEIRVGQDPVLAVRAPRNGDYLLRVANITFHGNAACVYRITLSTQPMVVAAFPNAGQAGTTSPVLLHTMTGIPGPFQSTSQDIAWPRNARTISPWGNRGPQLLVQPGPQRAEQEPNNKPMAAEPLAVGTTVHGKLGRATDVDIFRFEASQGQRILFNARAAAPGLPTLPRLRILDASGKPVASASAVDSPDREARLDWQAPTEGTYLAEVRDLRFGSRGGNDFVYHLDILESQPGFSLHADTDALNLMQGQSSSLPLRVQRSGGFDGEITITVSGLPDGVRVTPGSVPAKANAVTLKFEATKDTASRPFPLTITGTASLGGDKPLHLKSQLSARHLGRDSEGVAVVSPTSDRFHLTVCHSPVFRLFCNEAYMYAHRGTVYRYAMEVERIGGFNEPITVQIGDRQNRDLDGIQMIPFVIPPNQTDGFLPIYLPETMHINIQSQSQLYSQAYAKFTDKHGHQQSVLVLSEKRNMIRTRPPVVKMFAVDETISGRPGESVVCRLRLERTTNFPGGMTVRLHAVESDEGDRNAEATHGFQVADTRFTAGSLETSARVTLPRAASTSKPLTLVFRATGRMPDGTEAITESRVRFLPGR